MLVVLLGYAYQLERGPELSQTPPSATAPVSFPNPEQRNSPQVQSRPLESEPAFKPVPSELLAVLHACMASPELRPPRGSLPDLTADPKILDDCLRGSESMDVLSRLSASLSTLGDQDREDAILLMAYLAAELIKGTPAMAERAAVLNRVLDGYRRVKGPHLSFLTGGLLALAYVRTSDLEGLAKGIQLALDDELEAGPVPHVLGPLLEASMTGPRLSKHGELTSSDNLRRGQDAINALESTVGRAIPQAVALGLGALQSDAQGYELRDALQLLEYAFLAGPKGSEPLREATPRLLDALAGLDVNRIQESGIKARTLSSLLVRTEAQLLAAGILDMEEVPPGGRTSPAELRRRWGIEPQPILTGDPLNPKWNRPPDFRRP